MKIEVCKKKIDHLGRNEWETIFSTSLNKANKRKAISIAKKESFITETEVRCYDDDHETTFHAFYEKGKLSINMSV